MLNAIFPASLKRRISMSTMRDALRNHLPPIIIIAILLVLMTWPTAVYVFDADTFWLPSYNRDVWIKF